MICPTSFLCKLLSIELNSVEVIAMQKPQKLDKNPRNFNPAHAKDSICKRMAYQGDGGGLGQHCRVLPLLSE
jgi:hypothetical protein